MLLIFLPCDQYVLKYRAIGRHARAAEPGVSNRTGDVSSGKLIAVHGTYSVGAATRKWYSDGDIRCNSVFLRQLEMLFNRKEKDLQPVHKARYVRVTTNNDDICKHCRSQLSRQDIDALHYHPWYPSFFHPYVSWIEE